jgi:hypothetical protein
MSPFRKNLVIGRFGDLAIEDQGHAPQLAAAQSHNDPIAQSHNF